MKYPSVLQHNEEDCGAACLATVAKYYGRIFSLNRTREAAGTGQQGTTLLGLKRGAESLGFIARPVKANPEVIERLDEIPLPIIIHWQGNHWVVLYGQKRKKYIIADPAVGIRFLSHQELMEGWSNGLMLLIEPDESRFYEQPNDEIKSFGHFFNRISLYRSLLSEAVALNLVAGILSLIFPFLIQILTDDVLVRQDQYLLTVIALAAITLNLFKGVLEWLQSILVAHFAQRLELGLALEFCRQILRLPLKYYETHRSGEMTSRLQDITEINQLVSEAVITLPREFFVALISLGLMAFYSWQLTVIALLITLMMTLSTILFLPTLQRKTKSVLIKEAENHSVLVETFKGALTLKTSNVGPQAWSEFQSRFGGLANLSFRTTQINIINRTFSRLVAGIGSISLLWFGSYLVIENRLSIGQLLAFHSLNQNLSFLILTIVEFVDEFTRVKAATTRLTDVLEFPPETSPEKAKPWVTLAKDTDIICTDLNFSYAGRAQLVKDFSLTIPGGKITALIGSSGCGKSTLIKLIAGLYPLDSGNIRFGIYNQQDIALECLRQQVVLVPQEPHFWHRSIIDNFRFCYPHLSFEQIVQACQLAQADDFISNLPDKYQTVLGEFAANISGGQKQRLAIARGIATDPSILILDESTAALDPVTEADVIEKILDERRQKTTILITHRPSVICKADWIAFIKEGSLVVAGTPQELQQLPGEHQKFLAG